MELKLPASITSKRDVIKMRREIERILEALLQKRVAKTKSDVDRTVPRPGKTLQNLLDSNKLEVKDEDLDQVYNW